MVKVIGELIESIAGRAGLKNVREFGERLAKPGKGRAAGGAAGVLEKLLDVLGSDLLDQGQTVIAGMKSTTGQGDPERGDAFGRSQSMFDSVNEGLKAAVPGDRWHGAGSQAYADQNTRQQRRSDAMADADHQVHRVLFREAAQITLRRGYLNDQYNFLATTSYVTFPLQFIPRYGEAMKMAIEIQALQVALGESYYQVSRLKAEVAQNAAELHQVVGRYSEVADGAESIGATFDFDSPPLPSGGGARSGTLPTEQSQPRDVSSGIAPSSGVSDRSTAAPAGASGSTFTMDSPRASQPTSVGLPPLPQLPPLPHATGQPPATPGRHRSKKAARVRDDETDELTDDDKDPTKAKSSAAESQRAPVSNPGQPQAPPAARLVSENPPGPPAGAPQRDS